MHHRDRRDERFWLRPRVQHGRPCPSGLNPSRYVSLFVGFSAVKLSNILFHFNRSQQPRNRRTEWRCCAPVKRGCREHPGQILCSQHNNVRFYGQGNNFFLSLHGLTVTGNWSKLSYLKLFAFFTKVKKFPFSSIYWVIYFSKVHPKKSPRIENFVTLVDWVKLYNAYC